MLKAWATSKNKIAKDPASMDGRVEVRKKETINKDTSELRTESQVMLRAMKVIKT